MDVDVIAAAGKRQHNTQEQQTQLKGFGLASWHHTA